MAHRPAAARRFLAAAALAAGAAVFASPAFAVVPTMSPKTLQCDGSFASGVITSHPNPTIQVDEQSASGMKPGQRRLNFEPGNTVGLWRFDGNYTVTVSSCYTGGCSGGDSCQSWTYTYVQSGEATLTTGVCTYRDTTSTLCTNTMALYGAVAPNQAIVPLGGATCPASTTTLPSGSGTTAITPTGPLAGTAANGLSAQALQLNGSNWVTAPQNGAWNIGPNYTLAAWVNASGDGRILSHQSAQGWWGIGISGGALRFFDSRDSANFPGDLTNSDLTKGPVITGGWHLVHVVRRNATDRRWYVDGRLVGTATAVSTNSFTTHPINAPLEFGRYSGGGENLTGSLDDVRILSRILTDDDVMLDYTTMMHKYSSNGGVNFSTVAGSYSGVPAYGTTGIVTYVPGEAYTANGRWIFLAQNIDGEPAITPSQAITIDNSPPIAPSLTATPTSINDITWSWGASPRVCLPPGSASVTFNLIDAQSGATLIPPGAMAYPTSTVGETIAGSPNQLVSRKLRVTDNWGSGLGNATSAYTLANPALANSVVPTFVTTGGAVINWNQNGNPAYTRWLLAFSASPTFATGVSTPLLMTSDFTGSSYALSGLAQGTTYYARVQSFSGRSADSFGGATSVFVSTAFVTLPAAPGLGGAPLSNSAILWTWTAVPGAQYYKLFDIGGTTLTTTGGLSFPQGGLAVNTQYTTQVEAVSGNGGGLRTIASAFTLANDPTAPLVNVANASSITYVWNANGNPGYTYYEVSVTTDVTFGFIVTSLTVNATTATITGLLPATTYYARMRSVNGGQVLGSYVVMPSTRTSSDPNITTVLAPPSAYVPPNGSVGQWHFDESTGTTAADSSGFANTALFTCVTAVCTSTPTFTAGPSGLGTAAAFSGVAAGLVRVPDSANYAFTDSLTVSAWVNPNTFAQPNGAGIVVRGSGTAENFALDVNANLWRFMPKPGFTASSTNTISVSNWTHLIGVYDSAVGSATLYVNGRAASTVLLVPARTAANHDITIGNRQSGLATGYDRGFLGNIDSVRVQHRALNAAEALAEFQGSYVSTITPPSPNNQIQIGLAPNAFGAPATMFVSMDPLLHPILVSPTVVSAGLTVIPTGYTLVPNSIIEIVPIVSGNPFTTPLGSSASISMPYTDGNGDNIVDGSNPPLAASKIQVYTLNTAVNRWEALPTYVDGASRRATTFTPHFSIFAMFSPMTVGTELAQVRVYPVPWKPGSRTKFDATGITFDRLPTSGLVRIVNLAGERIREFSFNGADAGTVVWNGLTDDGRRTASGVYFARITSDSGGSSLVKFAIER